MKFKIECGKCGAIQPLLVTKKTDIISVGGHAHIDNTDVFIECNKCGNEAHLHIDHDE